jgi:hypothetical protein
LGRAQALLVALRELREEIILPGWVMEKAGERAVAQQAWVDSGYMAEVVYGFCRESGERFRPAVGRGAAQQRRQWYNRPTQTGSTVKFIGEGFHVNWLPSERLHLVEVDSDHWKSWVHERLATPRGQAGAMTLCAAKDPQEHLSLAKHLTAEARTEEYVAARGGVAVKWERLRRQNHWFDALYNACAAGSGCGVRLVQEEVAEPPPRPAPQREEDERVPWIYRHELRDYPRW